MGFQRFPIVTVGVVTLNREWVISRMLSSLLSQDYPHERIYVLLVDGGSEDQTVEIARKMLEGSDLMGFDIIVRECGIPEGRNICIEKMRGEVLVFWDSDVITEPSALRQLVTFVLRGKADVVFTDMIPVMIDSMEELDDKVKRFSVEKEMSEEGGIIEVPYVGMGHTAVSKRVFDKVRFDPDLTFLEDAYFSVKAREKGFKLGVNSRAHAYDINLRRRYYSDIYMDMPLARCLKGVRKKAEALVLAYRFSVGFKDGIRFFLNNKRHIFYVGYIPVMLFTVYGLLSNSPLSFMLPLYLMFFTLWQIKRRGLRTGIRAVLRSVLFGVPNSTFLAYYFFKHALINKMRR